MARLSMLVFSRPTSVTSLAKFTHSHPSPGNPVLLDINAACKAKAISNVCCHCRAAGHWVKDCLHKFDVWYMDTDKLETVLEDKLAAKDAALAEPPTEPELSALV